MPGDEPPSAHPLARLFDPATVRVRCAAVLRSVEADVSPYFSVDRAALPAVAERVAALTLRRFPDLVIPVHSRWRHFEAGGVDRKAELDAALGALPPDERARAAFDLTVVPVNIRASAVLSPAAATRNSPPPKPGANTITLSRFQVPPPVKPSTSHKT